MPAEWEPMSATWLGWPVFKDREQLWGTHYQQVCEAFALVARTVARYQLCIVAAHAPLVAHAKALCGPSVDVVGFAVEDNWLRDCGSIFLVNDALKTQLAARFVFNAWGNKYAPYDGCASFAKDMAVFSNVSCVESSMVLEGGSFFPGYEAINRVKKIFKNFKEAHILKQCKHMPSKVDYLEIQQKIKDWIE